MTAVFATAAGILLAALVLVLVKTVGQNRTIGRLATGVGALCLAGFVIVNVSDWPGGFWNQFWLDHAIVGATAGTPCCWPRRCSSSTATTASSGRL